MSINNVNTYTKIVYNRPTMFVEAQVLRNGVRCEKRHFIAFVNTAGSLERRFKKAHKRADKTMRTLQRHEVL